jgi:5-(carboxyamino)imidazole ribonucleotide synthase
MVARSITGDIVSYPVVETIHKQHICDTVLAPAPVLPPIQKKARTIAERVMQEFPGAGVFGIELFLTKTGEVLVNEIAPRVHNSGHYTIEACVTDQFEQHIRAITGLPLGRTEMRVPAAVMVNILGDRQGPVDVVGRERALGVSGVALHLYGKAETKRERKMGHITVVDTNLEKAYKKARLARKYISV